MKVGELRKVLRAHSADELRTLVVELYKTLPRTVKDAGDIDRLLRDPGTPRQRRGNDRPPQGPTFTALREDVEEFLSRAHDQLYLRPNRVVPKRERPKWRFEVMRFYRDLLLSAQVARHRPRAADLLESIYQLLCRATSEALFSTDDPFRSIQVDQDVFLAQLLTLRQAHLTPREFVPHALAVTVENPLGPETLHSSLIAVLLAHLKSPALRQMAIDECTARLEKLERRALEADDTGPYRRRSAYDHNRELSERLVETGFRCHLALADPDGAIDYFQRYRKHDQPEIELYVLLRLLADAELPELWVREYDRAVEAGVEPRGVLQRLRRAREHASGSQPPDR